MNDYNKNYFWTSVDPETKIKKYFFKINGTMVEVNKEVYNVCFSSYVKTLRDHRRDAEFNLLSLDYTDDDENSFHNILPAGVNVEKEVHNQLMIEAMRKEIEQLSDEEKKIVLSLLQEDISVNKLSKQLNIPYMTLQRKVKLILTKLREKLEK